MAFVASPPSTNLTRSWSERSRGTPRIFWTRLSRSGCCGASATAVFDIHPPAWQGATHYMAFCPTCVGVRKLSFTLLGRTRERGFLHPTRLDLSAALPVAAACRLKWVDHRSIHRFATSFNRWPRRIPYGEHRGFMVS